MDDFEQTERRFIMENNALTYIAGYVAHRFRTTHSDLSIPTKTLSHISQDWLSFISKRHCMYPSTTNLTYLTAANIINDEFERFHGTFFSKESKLFDKLTDIVCTKTGNKLLHALCVRGLTFDYAN